MEVQFTDKLPDWVRYFHRFAKEGAGDVYRERWVKLNVTAADRDLWHDTRNIQSVWLVYQPASEKKEGVNYVL